MLVCHPRVFSGKVSTQMYFPQLSSRLRTSWASQSGLWSVLVLHVESYWSQSCFLRILSPSQGIPFVPWRKASGVHVYVHLRLNFIFHLFTLSVLVWVSIKLTQEWHLEVLALGCLCSPPKLLDILCSLYFILYKFKNEFISFCKNLVGILTRITLHAFANFGRIDNFTILNVPRQESGIHLLHFIESLSSFSMFLHF